MENGIATGSYAITISHQMPENGATLASEVTRMTTQRVLLNVLLLALSAGNAGVADVTGRWKVTIAIGDETITGVALLKQTGDKVTGSIGPDEQNQHPLEGVVEGNRVTLTTRPRPGRSVAFDTCYLAVDGEKKMTGTTERKGSSDTGTIEFERTGHAHDPGVTADVSSRTPAAAP